MSAHVIRIIHSDKELEQAFPVIAQLRSAIDYPTFYERVLIQRAEGYRLVTIEDNGQVLGVAGFRILHCLPLGRFMYIDDFVTAQESRQQGVGKALFNWLEDYARNDRCSAIQLDSGVQRLGAQKFYTAMNMEMTCNHYTKMLSGKS
jgi:GNAT superfamily N-acetyltransferase